MFTIYYSHEISPSEDGEMWIPTFFIRTCYKLKVLCPNHGLCLMSYHFHNKKGRNHFVNWQQIIFIIWVGLKERGAYWVRKGPMWVSLKDPTQTELDGITMTTIKMNLQGIFQNIISINYFVLKNFFLIFLRATQN